MIMNRIKWAFVLHQNTLSKITNFIYLYDNDYNL